MKAYFLSDLHLQNMQDERAGLFLNFLRGLQSDAQLSHLFLVGDIFDLWIADHSYFVAKFTPIVDELKQLRARGVEIHYFEGNHDLYLHRFWQAEMGFHVHADWQIFTLAGLRVRVEHGDLIDVEDRGYRFLRWLLRTPAMTWVAHNLHNRWVATIGERASQASRVYTSETKTISQEQAIAKIRQHARQLGANEPLDFVISGHLHTRDEITLDAGQSRVRSVNLGSWFDRPMAYLITPQEQHFIEIPHA